MTIKEKFDKQWHSNWFHKNGTLRWGSDAYSSWGIQPLFKLAYMAIDGMEEFLTMPEKDLQ